MSFPNCTNMRGRRHFHFTDWLCFWVTVHLQLGVCLIRSPDVGGFRRWCETAGHRVELTEFQVDYITKCCLLLIRLLSWASTLTGTSPALYTNTDLPPALSLPLQLQNLYNPAVSCSSTVDAEFAAAVFPLLLMTCLEKHAVHYICSGPTRTLQCSFLHSYWMFKFPFTPISFFCAQTARSS